jgi:long-subunit fatty acid transport protein
MINFNLVSFTFSYFPTRKWILCGGFLLGTVLSAFSQQSDFQLWGQAGIGYNLTDNIKISFEEEIRLKENVSQIKKEVSDLGLVFKLNKAFRVGLHYRLELNYKNPDERSWRNGLYTDIMFRQKLHRFQFDYRLRLQSPKIESLDDVSTTNQWFTNRHKISLQYNIKGIPLVPFIEGEIFVPVEKQQSLYIDEYRIWAGIAYNINKKNEIALKYGIQQEINVADPLRAYVLNISYSLDLN